VKVRRIISNIAAADIAAAKAGQPVGDAEVRILSPLSWKIRPSQLVLAAVRPPLAGSDKSRSPSALPHSEALFVLKSQVFWIMLWLVSGTADHGMIPIAPTPFRCM